LTRLLITGGAGFVGSNLAVSLAVRHPDWEVLALDNLYRRGSRATCASPTTSSDCPRSRP
jgi:nucleoside-diphosphate-sugar epimerase